MKAYVAVQKRLLLMVYALWCKGCVYEADYMEKLAEAAKKIAPTGETTQDQEAKAILSYM